MQPDRSLRNSHGLDDLDMAPEHRNHTPGCVSEAWLDSDWLQEGGTLNPRTFYNTGLRKGPRNLGSYIMYITRGDPD